MLIFHPAHKAYKAMSDHYAWWIMLPQDEFSRIVDPSDQVFILLAANCTSTPHPATFLTIAAWSSQSTLEAKLLTLRP